jgi:hypothetical protein
MNKLIVTAVVSCLLTVLSIKIQGQSAIPSRIHAQTTLNKLSAGVSPSQVMVGIAPPAGEVIGTTYLNDGWKKGPILLYKDEAPIENYFIKYDIQANLLEIQDAHVVKGLEGARVKSFMWISDSLLIPDYFINARAYKNEGTAMSGFFQVIVDGPLPLFKKTEISIQKANYVKEFDTGSRDEKIHKKEIFYYADQNEVFKIPKKKLTAIFKDRSQEMDQFIGINNLNPKNIIDLQRIFEKYNSFFKTDKN